MARIGPCFYCGQSTARHRHSDGPRPDYAATIDHVFPASFVRAVTEKMGPLPRWWVDKNKVTACELCNSMKGRLDPLDWLVIMPSDFGAKRLAELLVDLDVPMEEVFAAMRRRKR